ncbi:hypothetical protein ID866_7755 [Astraeus odoratus]|nr:hypothetical protein ID866_7755 [Astraeus odoratus]
MFSDSPQQEARSVDAEAPPRASPAEGTTQHASATHAPEPSASTNTESTSSDKLTALPGISSSPASRIHQLQQQQRAPVPISSSDPSIHGTISPRVFPSVPDRETPKAVSSEGSTGKHTSSTPGRVSFDGPRNYAPVNHTPRSQQAYIHPLLREAVHPSRGTESAPSRLTGSSDPPKPPTVIRSNNVNTSSRKQSIESPRSGSRAASPMRLFQWGFHRRDQHDHEEPFVPVDPFLFRPRRHRFSIVHSPDPESALVLDPSCEETLFWCLPTVSCNPKDRFRAFMSNVRYFVTDSLPRQVYLHLLLRLPSLYFSRIARLFEDAQISQPDIERMIAAAPPRRERNYTTSPIPRTAQLHNAFTLPCPDEWTASNTSPALVRFKKSWEEFIDSLLREWKTFNLVSALLLSSVLITLTCNKDICEMAYDPLVRTTALLSLTCALMSLSYGATRWALETQRTTTFMLWNVWILLAMPGIWLAWSMVFFIASILSFVWRSGSTTDPSVPTPLSPSAATGPRVLVSAFILFGLVYFAAIVKTLQGYGLAKESANDGPRERASGNVERGDGREHREEEGERGRARQRGADRRAERVREERRDKDRSGPHDHDPGQDEHRTNAQQHDAVNREEGVEQGGGGLSAVMGLGLTGLDSVATPRTSSQQDDEKREGESGSSSNH